MTVDGITTEKRGIILTRDPHKRNRWKKMGEFASGHNDSIDEAPPPPGYNRNDLTVTRPLTLIHVTSAQLDHSAKKGGDSSQAAHIEEALEKKEDGKG